MRPTGVSATADKLWMIYPHVFATSVSDEAIQLYGKLDCFLSGKLDCFAEPVIGPREARTRWLAMTQGLSPASKRQLETQ